MRTRRSLWTILWMGLALLVGGAAQAADTVGVVLMHGKWGGPQRNIVGLAQALEREGMVVSTPEMPWSGSREYDADQATALKEIDAAVARLKEKGATKIVVGGHSFGANTALAYGANREGLAGILALAPGHAPESPGFYRVTGEGVAKAREMVAAGKGDEKDTFPDSNQGKSRMVRMAAKVYLSYFDPNGGAVMPRNAANLKDVPLMWVVGTEDGMFKAGEGYAFAKAPANPMNRYVVVNAGHADTPDTAIRQVIDWIKALP